MSPHFGSRVTDSEAYDKAVREEKGGASTFGVRVTGAIKGDGPVATAKRATEHGPLVVAGAQQSNTKGEPADAVSIDELRNILAENPTTLDSLYEAELGREGGPRPEALHIIREVERGIKGAGRREILDEIAELLGETAASAAHRADLNAGFLKQREQMAKREQENVALRDAGRLKSIRERNENLKAVEDASGREGDAAPLPSDTRTQAERAAGIERHPRGIPATVPAKPEGPIQPETQSPVQPLVPKGESDGENDGEAGGEDGGEIGDASEVENATVAELREFLGDEEVQKLTEKGGSGADGSVVKADLVKAAKRKVRAAAK